MWSRTREVRFLMTFFISLLYYELKQKKVAQSYHNIFDICVQSPPIWFCAIKVVFLRSVTNVIVIISLLYSHYGCINTTDKIPYQAGKWPTSDCCLASEASPT